MKVIIAGGRDFNDFKRLCEVCDKILSNQLPDDIIIVSGQANGADKLGERYAKLKGYQIESHPAQWDKYKRAAGFIRNKEMAESADSLIAFWDLKSKGTSHMINLSRESGLNVRVLYY